MKNKNKLLLVFSVLLFFFIPFFTNAYATQFPYGTQLYVCIPESSKNDYAKIYETEPSTDNSYRFEMNNDKEFESENANALFGMFWGFTNHQMLSMAQLYWSGFATFDWNTYEGQYAFINFKYYNEATYGGYFKTQVEIYEEYFIIYSQYYDKNNAFVKTWYLNETGDHNFYYKYYDITSINAIEIIIQTRADRGATGNEQRIEVRLNDEKTVSIEGQNYYDSLWDWQNSNLYEIHFNGQSNLPDNREFNCFMGFRALATTNDYVAVDSFFLNFPRYKDNVYQEIAVDEPPIAEYTIVWEYSSYEVDFDTYENQEIGIYTEKQSLYNESITIIYDVWEIDFPLCNVEARTNSHYVYLIDPLSWGDWNIWNFVRDTLVNLCNVFILFVNFCWYFLVLSLGNFVIMYLIVGVIFGGIIWNILIKYSYFALLWVVWFLALFFLIIWEFIIWIGVMLWNLIMYFWNWLWNNVIIPLWEWFWIEFFPIIIECFIFVLVIILTSLLWMISLGQTDFVQLFNQVHEMVIYVSNFFIESVIFFIINIPAFLTYFTTLLILISYTFGKLYFCKIKGFTNRVEQLQLSFDSYMYITIEIPYKLIKKLLDLIPMI